MRDLGLYRDMSENTENYNVFNTKINHYIDYVNELIPENMRNILSQYNISYEEYCKRFYDFENNKIRKEDNAHPPYRNAGFHGHLKCVDT